MIVSGAKKGKDKAPKGKDKDKKEQGDAAAAKDDMVGAKFAGGEGSSSRARHSSTSPQSVSASPTLRKKYSSTGPRLMRSRRL